MSYAPQPRAADVDSYARVSRSFPAWLRRNFRGDRIARELAYHLVMSVNPVGVEFVPVAVLAGFIDATPAQVEAAMVKLSAAGFLRYDHETEFVWVVEQAAWQVNVGNTKNQDAMVRRLVRPAFGVPNFWPEFMAKYEVNLRLNLLGFSSENLPVNSSLNSSPKSSDNSSPNSSVKSMVTQDAGYRKQDTGSSIAAAREAHAAAAALTPDHDPWPEQASRAAAHLYIEIRRGEGVEPYGDVCEPFERAALMLRDRLGIPAEKVSATLERIMRHASTDPAVRRARAGDLFRSPFYLLGNPSPKGGGVPMADKLRRHLEDLAQHDARTAAPTSRPPVPWELELDAARVTLDEPGFHKWLLTEPIPADYGPDDLVYRPDGFSEERVRARIEEVLDERARAT